MVAVENVFGICKRESILREVTMFETSTRVCAMCIMFFFISSNLFAPLSLLLKSVSDKLIAKWIIFFKSAKNYPYN
jgi:hypothetical protein